MQANPKIEVRNQKGDVAEDGLVTRPGLATALQVSVCTVDRMVTNGDIPCIRVRGRVRFCLADVVEALRDSNRKFGRRAVAPGSERAEPGHLTQPSPQSGEGAAVTRWNGGAA
jgi:excisionase family DNA binding protein